MAHRQELTKVREQGNPPNTLTAARKINLFIF